MPDDKPKPNFGNVQSGAHPRRRQQLEGDLGGEFHISKPDGWPAGTYKLEVLANGKPAGAAQFTVTD